MFDADLIDLIRAALQRGETQTEVALALNGAVAAFLVNSAQAAPTICGTKVARIMFEVTQILDPSISDPGVVKPLKTKDKSSH